MSTELDILYSPSEWSKRLPATVILEKHVELNTKNSNAVRQDIKSDLNIPYGAGEREVIDIYGTDLNDDAPILIHIHGGYWYIPTISHKNNAFISRILHKNNIKSILVGYELCPNVTVEEICKNIEAAITKSLEYAKKHKPRGIYLSGHSVGAHLVATLFQNFIPSLPTEDQKLFKAAFLLAGIYDIVPLIKTETNIPLKLDETSAKALSPLFQTISAGEGTNFFVIAAENDSPAFVEDGRKMHAYLLSLGIKSEFFLIENVDHFDLLERLIDEDFELSKLIIEVINK